MMGGFDVCYFQNICQLYAFARVKCLCLQGNGAMTGKAAPDTMVAHIQHVPLFL